MQRLVAALFSQVQFQGLTGRVQFEEGVRSYIKWDLLKLRKMKLDKVSRHLQQAKRHENLCSDQSPEVPLHASHSPS